jgi:hypothetical protein
MFRRRLAAVAVAQAEDQALVRGAHFAPASSRATST